MKIKEKGVDVGKSIAAAISESLYKSPEEIDILFNRLEQELVSQGKNDWERIEISRRIVESKISLLFKRNDSPQVFYRVWYQMLKVGFPTPEREASMLFYYGRFLLNVDADREKIIDVINQLDSVIRNNISMESPSLEAHFLKIKHQLCQSLADKFD